MPAAMGRLFAKFRLVGITVRRAARATDHVLHSALEMAAILCDLRPGDEVIMPSFTFVSTANAVFCAGRGLSLSTSDLTRRTPVSWTSLCWKIPV
jgi:hypothetical protein